MSDTQTGTGSTADDVAAYALQVARRRHAWQALTLGPLWQPRTGSLPGAGARMAVQLPAWPDEAGVMPEAPNSPDTPDTANTTDTLDAPDTPSSLPSSRSSPHDGHPAWSDDHALADWDAVPWMDDGQDFAPADGWADSPAAQEGSAREGAARQDATREASGRAHQPESGHPEAAHQEAQHQETEPLTPAQRWIQLREDVADCRRCRLADTRTHTVFGRGEPKEARWLLIGEAPGAEEDRRGEAFVGQAGKLLDAMLSAAGIDPDADVFIANVLKCRPPGNRNPERDEVAACEAFLHEQVRLVKPDCIILLGRFAAQSVLQSDLQIGRLRNKRHHITLDGREVPVVVTYHPAYLLRNQRDKLKAWEDLCLARSTVPAPAT